MSSVNMGRMCQSDDKCVFLFISKAWNPEPFIIGCEFDKHVICTVAMIVIIYCNKNAANIVI